MQKQDLKGEEGEIEFGEKNKHTMKDRKRKLDDVAVEGQERE